ncbi:Pyrophosphate--fructose 6-phosphate 1-phosphotransferase [subsurface metagenome]
MKGNLLILQSGGPTAVINSSCCGIIHKALENREQIKGIYGAVNGILGVLNEVMVDLTKEDPATLDLLKQTPSSALGSCRYKLTEKDYQRALSVLEAYNIRYCFFIGGNDTMDTANKVSNIAREHSYKLRIIGVPKTVDNDIVGTDHCPGYPSVARWLAIAVRDAGLDTKAIYTTDPVKIIETMGRDSGWITASTALARDESGDPPHLIYLPERPFEEDRFIKDVKGVYNRLGYVVITVSEGLKDKKGVTLVESSAKVDVDTFGHAQRGGVADYLCNLIKDRLEIKARFDKPGTIQRVSMMCASEVDTEEAYQVGRVAVEQALQGKSGYMITLERFPSDEYKYTTGLMQLEHVANLKKEIPNEFINDDSNDVTEEFLEWARPLIKPGLPEYARLKRVPVKKKL